MIIFSNLLIFFDFLKLYKNTIHILNSLISLNHYHFLNQNRSLNTQIIKIMYDKFLNFSLLPLIISIKLFLVRHIHRFLILQFKFNHLILNIIH